MLASSRIRLLVNSTIRMSFWLTTDSGGMVSAMANFLKGELRSFRTPGRAKRRHGDDHRPEPGPHAPHCVRNKNYRLNLRLARGGVKTIPAARQRVTNASCDVRVR